MADPAEPSRLRAGIWRKLKAAGAIYLQNGVAALPAGPASERALRGIGQDVRGMGGTAQLFHGRLLGDEEAVRGQFNAARDEEYTELPGRGRRSWLSRTCQGKRDSWHGSGREEYVSRSASAGRTCRRERHAS
jgi:hypothetical protein